MSAFLNQQIVRKIRSAMSTEQQEFFYRVFFKNEKLCEVLSDMGTAKDIEESMLRSLRSPISIDE